MKQFLKTVDSSLIESLKNSQTLPKSLEILGAIHEKHKQSPQALKFIEHEYVTLRLQNKSPLTKQDLISLSLFHSLTSNQFLIPYKDKLFN